MLNHRQRTTSWIILQRVKVKSRNPEVLRFIHGKINILVTFLYYLAGVTVTSKLTKR